MDLKRIEQGVKLILSGIGEDVNREGLVDTPKRVAKMYQEICCGLEDPKFKLTTFENKEKYNQMISVTNIPFYSICEHHLCHFSGKAHIGYLPGKRYVGLSKLARVAEHFARRPQVQERLTQQIADFLDTELKPLGVIVMIQAEHLCMSARGIQKPGHITTTTALKGLFSVKPDVKEEFFRLTK